MTTQAHIQVAVAGASGYTGGELLRLLLQHPKVRLTAVTSEKSAGAKVASVFPNLAGVCSLSLEAMEPEALAAKADVIFLALPHTKSHQPVAICHRAGKLVIDLSADFRLKRAEVYEQWYQASHPQADLLSEAVYGLPELHRTAIQRATIVASPGCYPTAAILQMAPLVAQGLVDPATIVVDAKSGISGAGRSPALPYHFPEAHESLEPYKIGSHRHIPEIEQELTLVASRAGNGDVRVAFTPHLVPMNRGILSTAYARLRTDTTIEALRSLYRDFYKGERFVRLSDGSPTPNPRHVRGTNFLDLAAYVDRRTGWVVTVAALDNLVKGAGGQAIQAMNLMVGYPEETGLMGGGLFP